MRTLPAPEMDSSLERKDCYYCCSVEDVGKVDAEDELLRAGLSPLLDRFLDSVPE